MILTPELRLSSKMEPCKFCKSCKSTGAVVVDKGGKVVGGVVVDNPPPRPASLSNSRSNGTEVGPEGS